MYTVSFNYNPALISTTSNVKGAFLQQSFLAVDFERSHVYIHVNESDNSRF